MFYYPYNADSVVTDKLTMQPENEDYCISDENFNLDLNMVIVGAVDENKNLTWRTIKAKPAEILAKALENANDEIINLKTMFALMDAAQDYNLGV